MRRCRMWKLSSHLGVEFDSVLLLHSVNRSSENMHALLIPYVVSLSTLASPDVIAVEIIGGTESDVSCVLPIVVTGTLKGFSGEGR